MERDSKFQNVIWIGIPGNSNDSRISAQTILADLKANHEISHVMVEGGPTTARQFLAEKQVDRAILVYAPMNFEIPLPSNLNRESFEEAGLELIRESTVGVDRVEYW
eukprot:CAMPEP_0176142212 /NCGR_PEP_ID=MMETSP0120_2-20121206/72346_1 /TAXON_ID=160619 /ORGANISM="Kryptoperidinium foliaceum, Strain CCMP 1326" /LENGTH=106 /DNA_ID=CAMNT_0017478425 /DNA_START=8 /DNA_END=325 /DNA_ORIENTATION=-